MDPATFYELLRANFIQAIPHGVECGMAIESVDERGARAIMPYRPDWLGDTERRVMHTGIITTFVDTICGLAAVAGAGRFEAVATLDLRMDFLRPAGPDIPLRVFAHCYRLTRSISFVRAHTWQAREDEPVAVTQATFMRGRAGLMGNAQP